MIRIRLLTWNASVLILCVSTLFSGCANMSGLGGSSEYGCKAPQGVQCDSVSGNYYNAIQNNLPSQRQHHPAGAAGNGATSDSQPVSIRSSSTSGAAPIIDKAGLDPASPQALAPSPLRSQARVLRLWFKPWEDADHDLVDQGFVYVQIDDGRWLIDHAQQRIRDAYAPIRPPKTATIPAVPPATVPAKPADPSFFGTGAAGRNSSQLVTPSISMPGATDLPADDSQ